MIAILEKFIPKQSRGVGLEITTDRVNMALVQKKGDQYKLLKRFSKELAEGIFEDGKIIDAPALAQVIQEMFKEAKIKTKRLATAVSLREAIIRIIPIPAELPEQEAHDYISNQEAALYLPYPREEVDIDYQRLGEYDDEDGIRKVSVLLVATRREVTDSYLDTFRQAGLSLDVLEINSFALIRTLKKGHLQLFGPQEAVVLVDIEFDNTEIAIIVEGVPGFTRTVPIGAYQLNRALSQAMNLPTSRDTRNLQEINIPPAALETVTGTGMTSVNPGMAAVLRVLGELTDELRRSINFYVNQSSNVEVTQLLLVGPGSAIGQLDEYFSKHLSLPATQVDPVASMSLQVDQDLSNIERYGLGTVIGLGMRMI